jgi:tetratricopeptide (TPR) repeat protein
MFRRNIHEAIDRQIKEAMLKPLTADNLNYISDLYHRKGEKELAIECLYNAITKLHVSQREKMIAIYKKIVKLAPGDEKAYKGLIDIFAKMGLVAEEVNHLILLAKAYQSRGDYEKVNELYRRTHLIDPDNETAAKYFGKGKPSVPDYADKDMENEFGENAAFLSGHPEIGDLTGIALGSGGPDAGQDEMRIEMQGGRRISETGDTFADEVPGAREDWDATAVPAGDRNKRVYLIIGIAVLLLLLAVAAGFLVNKKVRGGLNSAVQGQEKAAASQGAGEKHKEAGGIRITVVRLTDTGADEGGLGKVVGQQAMTANQFYSVTLQAATGCLPDEFVRDPLSMISFIGGMAVEDKTTVVTGLERMNRTVHKATVPGCGENKAVFMKLFVAHPKGQRYKGIMVRMMEKGVPESITWD